jgi:hypothetical protein
MSSTVVKGFTLVAWMIATVCLVCTFIGMLLFIPRDNGQPSTWMRIGLKLLNTIIDDN